MNTLFFPLAVSMKPFSHHKFCGYCDKKRVEAEAVWDLKSQRDLSADLNCLNMSKHLKSIEFNIHPLLLAPG